MARKHKYVDCPFCEARFTLPGLSGHLRMKHKLSREDTDLIVSGRASEEEIEALMEAYGEKEEERIQGAIGAEEKEEREEELDILSQAERVVTLIDRLEEVREKKEEVVGKRLFRSLLSENQKIALSALARAEEQLRKELIELCSSDVKEKLEKEKELDEVFSFSEG